jgi:LPS-assembly protein
VVYTGQPVVAGGRLHVEPSVSLPLHWLGAHVRPKLQLQSTGYSVHDHAPHNVTRVLPVFSVDSGMVFSRPISFFRNNYEQTLEPRIFYLFVPTTNQDDVPNFGTNLPGFNFAQLFRTNRFSGIDRIGDANQVSIALTTRFLDDNGQEKLNAGIGQVVSVHKHQVVLPDNAQDTLATEHLSPLVGQVKYAVTPRISANASTAWDPNHNRFNTNEVRLQYRENTRKVVNFWYNYSLRGDTSTQKPNANLERVGLSVGWQAFRNWNILGNLEYNVSHKRAQNYIYGLEYDSCCWAIRLVKSITFIGSDVGKNYDSQVYVQFFLKGLGDYGAGRISQNLSSAILGYDDKRFIGL